MISEYGRALREIETVSCTTTAQDVTLKGGRYVIQNTDDTNSVYLRSKTTTSFLDDEITVTATNGMVIFPKETTTMDWCLNKISVLSSAGTVSLKLIRRAD